jgi:hypothetical protein
MKGVKVVATLDDGSKENHFLRDHVYNSEGFKAATQQVFKHYETKGVTQPKLVANFFDDQRPGNPPNKDHLPGLSAEEKCYCGHWKRGECAKCPDELSFADNKTANP